MSRRRPQPLDPDVPTDDAPQYDKPSRSQAKRDAKATVPIADALVALSPQRLAKLELDEDLESEINEARGLKKGARKRQMKRIAGMLRDHDFAAIKDTLDALP